MKSVANQYRDLKEGKMSQTNFMRNLRMSFPQYITNVTSFDDSIKILKNKGILTEGLDELGPAAQQMAGNPEEEAEYRSMLIKKKKGKGDLIKYKNFPKGSVKTGEIIKDLGDKVVIFNKEDGLNHTISKELIEKDDDEEIAALIKKMEDEESGKYTKFQDFPGGISEQEINAEDIEWDWKNAEGEAIDDEEGNLYDAGTVFGKDSLGNTYTAKFVDHSGSAGKDVEISDIKKIENAKGNDLTLDENFNHSPLAIAKSVAQKYNWKLKQLTGKEKQDKALSLAYYLISKSGAPNAESLAKDLALGHGDEEWPTEYIDALYNIIGKSNESLNENFKYGHYEIAELVAQKHGDELKKLSGKQRQDAALSYAYQEIANSGIPKAKIVARNLVWGYADEDYPADYITALYNLLDRKSVKEGKGKDLQPNQIIPGELRMGIKVEMEHTDDPKKAEKIALDHLAENPFYYTALKLSGIESPSAPKVKEPKEVKKEKKKKDETTLVDKDNQMKKIKVVKENIEENELSQKIADLGLNAEKWDSMSHNEKLYAIDKNRFIPKALRMKAAKMSWDELTKEFTGVRQGFAIPTEPKRPGANLGASFDKFKKQLEEIIREVLNENSGFEYIDDKIIMNDNIKDAILDNPELQEFITPKSFVRNKNGQIILWIDWMEPEQFDKLANFLGIKY